MSTFAPWQRRPKPLPKVPCAVCLEPATLRDSWPVGGERMHRWHVAGDDPTDWRIGQMTDRRKRSPE